MRLELACLEVTAGEMMQMMMNSCEYEDEDEDEYDGDDDADNSIPETA